MRKLSNILKYDLGRQNKRRIKTFDEYFDNVENFDSESQDVPDEFKDFDDPFFEPGEFDSDMSQNISAILEVIKYIYDNIMYAELNTKSDYCQVCGYDGEIKIVDEDNQLIWECPNCKNRDKSKMNVSRRTCGYIGTNFWNQGRTEEINERYVHLDNHEYIGE